MNKYTKFISPFVFLISLILLISFRSVPSGQLWKEYNVLYVPAESEDSKILTALTKCEIQDAVYLTGQFLPVSLNENSIEISMLRLNYGSKDYEYTQMWKLGLCMCTRATHEDVYTLNGYARMW